VLMEVSDRLPSSPMNLLANTDGPNADCFRSGERVLRINPSKIFWLNSGAALSGHSSH